eukprot:COSAG01_NODE_3939_length_5514_cov_662.486057_11_plen_94_part_00
MGTALYTQIAVLNHSCAPNAAVVHGGSHLAQLRTTRALRRGEELTITYIDGNERLGVAARRRELQPGYGFVCECAKCGKCPTQAWARRLRPRS